MPQKLALGKKICLYSYIGGAGLAVFVVRRLLDGSMHLVLLFSAALALLICARVLTYLDKRPTLASHLVTMAAFVAVAGAQLKDGGKSSPSMWLISIVPLIAADLLGPKQILNYFVLSALCVSAPWIAEWLDWSYPSLLLLSPTEILTIRILAAVVVTTVCVNVGKEYDNYVVQLADKRGEVFKTHQEAQSLNQEKTEFLRQMSREIRAPLNGIKGMTQVWVRQKLDAETAESVATMDRCANNLLSIINDAQDLSQVEEHQFEITSYPFSISRMVNDIVYLFQGKAQEKNIELYAFGASENCFGIGDEKRLTQILSNFVGNAVKFSDQGRVELRWRWTDTGVRFEVSDEGIGMSQSQVDSLFTEFTQVHEEESVRRGGTGLGLTISKSLVEAMGGTLIVESEAGRGSCFRFDLPMQSCSLEQLEAHAKQDCSISSSQLDLRILLLDDDLASLWVQRLALESMGCRVECAKTASSALCLAKRKPFDLAIIDLRMPDTNGIEALAMLREQAGQQTQIPAIALTASADPNDKKACLDAGFAELLTKPFDYKALQCAVSKHSKTSSPPIHLERAA